MTLRPEIKPAPMWLKLAVTAFVIAACGLAMYGTGKAFQRFGVPAFWETLR